MAQIKLPAEFTASEVYEMNWAWIMRFRGVTKEEEKIIVDSLNKNYRLGYMRGYSAALKCTKDDTIQAEMEVINYLKNTG